MDDKNSTYTINFKEIVFGGFKNNLLAIVFMLILVSSAFIAGSFYTKVQYLQGNEDALGGNNPTLANSGKENQPVEKINTEVIKPTDRDHIKGNAKADIIVIEYSDFSCPFCKTYHDTMNKIIDDYGDKVGWVFRHFPLVSLHPLAFKQAEASECVAKLGGQVKFWDFTDSVFASKVQVTEEESAKIAGQLGINTAQLKTCLDGGEMTARVEGDYQSGIKAGVNGTPGNFIMNIKTGETVPLKGAVPYDQMKKAIDSMLQ